jgi:hypothetical protein
MPNFSPILNSFNAGIFSELMQMRVDIDRHPHALRKALNYIPTPQGPILARTGTAMKAPAYNNDTQSALLPFSYSDETAFALEFGDERMRIVTEDGLQIETPAACTVVSGAPVTFTADVGLCSIGDQVVFSGWPDAAALQTVVANIVNKVTVGPTTTYTTDATAGTFVATGSEQVARVYDIATPYPEAAVRDIRVVQDKDILYLFCEDYPPYKLSRYAAYDWRLEAVDFQDGPYMDANTDGVRLTLSSSGQAIANQVADSAQVIKSGEDASFPAWKVFDAEQLTSRWRSNTNQSGWVGWDFTAATVIEGYTIYVGRENSSADYSSVDYAPGDWTFEGSNDGVTWTILHTINGYVLYDGMRSVYFDINNTTAYRYYRINVTACTRNGPIPVVIGRLSMRVAGTLTATLTASAITGINRDTGFQTTDIGRLIRYKDPIDTYWRELKITARTSTTVVTVEFVEEPGLATSAISEWRLGYFSDTTGWPTCGAFFDDRLWLAGVRDFPTLFAASESGVYESFAPSDKHGTVLPTNGIAYSLNSKKASRIRWIGSDDLGLLMATGSEEWTVKPTNAQEAIHAGNIKARRAVARGAAAGDVVQVDRQYLYFQRGRRTLREMAYSYEADGYKSANLSLFASHLGVVPFAGIDYAAEPHSILWAYRDDGTLVGFTYNREENVLGWHEHDLAGGVVESMCVTSNSSGLFDNVWLVVGRVIGGAYKRFIEVISRPWDFGMTVEDCWYVDCGLLYNDEPTATIYARHLEGQTVYGLADGVPFSAVVTDFKFTLDQPAGKVVFGLGYDAECITVNVEGGSRTGTSQGKLKRSGTLNVALIDSAFGEIGKWNRDTDEYEYTQIAYREAFDELSGAVELQTLITEDIVLPPGGEERGGIAFRRRKEYPLPLNVAAIMPKSFVQDGQ